MKFNAKNLEIESVFGALPYSPLQDQLEYPASAVVIRVEGGVLVFDFLTDYETWGNQK